MFARFDILFLWFCLVAVSKLQWLRWRFSFIEFWFQFYVQETMDSNFSHSTHHVTLLWDYRVRLSPTSISRNSVSDICWWPGVTLPCGEDDDIMQLFLDLEASICRNWVTLHWWKDSSFQTCGVAQWGWIHDSADIIDCAYHLENSVLSA